VAQISVVKITILRHKLRWLYLITYTYIRLVLVVYSLYLNLDHVTLDFSLFLDHQRPSSSIYHLVHSHISMSSPIQHQHSRLNYFRIYFVDNKFEKIN
jgi:cell division protein FtsW (lipid II flippase)